MQKRELKQRARGEESEQELESLVSDLQVIDAPPQPPAYRIRLDDPSVIVQDSVAFSPRVPGATPQTALHQTQQIHPGMWEQPQYRAALQPARPRVEVKAAAPAASPPAAGAPVVPGSRPASRGNSRPSSRPASPNGSTGRRGITPRMIEEEDEDTKEEEEALFMKQIDRKVAALQQQGQHIAAVELMEKALLSRKNIYGAYSKQAIEASEKLALLYNSLAMSSLYREEYALTLGLLRKSEDLCSDLSQLVAVRVQTLNNLACCYRRMRKPKRALNLLRESLALLASQSITEGRAVTHLNMCAILSQLDRHREALEHAEAAVLHCQQQLLADSMREELLHHHGDKNSLLTEKIVILCISYHNLGVEEEFLRHFDKSLRWYQKALHLSKIYIGPDEPITTTFRESFLEAQRQIDQIRHMQQHQRSARSVAPPRTAPPTVHKPNR